MNGNFTRVNLRGDDQVTVAGWLTRAASDTDAQLSVAVTQNNVTLSGSGHVRKGEDTWDIDIDSNGFLPGVALGVAAAVVTSANGSTSQNWHSDPIPVH
jgi:hypothetical protein